MLKADTCTEESFLKDVATHEMSVTLDDGFNRILKFSRPGSNTYYFDILTWAGKLCISGDMGTWVFDRNQDMFNFFRSNESDTRLVINKSYWAEKVVSGTDRGGGSTTMEFSEEEFQRQIMYQVEDFTKELEDSDKAEFVEDLMYEVFNREHQILAQLAAHEFEWDGNQFFSDSIPDGMIYRYHFIWCLYAIVYAIQQYDKWKQEPQHV